MQRFQKIVAFGAGSGLKDLLSIKPDDIELVCVADNDPARIGQKVLGLDVVAADAIPPAIDAVIITAAAVDPIRQQLIGAGFPEDKIIPLCPSASHSQVAQANLDLRRLSDGLGVNFPQAGIATMYLRVNAFNPQATAWPVDFVRTQAFTLFAEQITQRNIPGSLAELGVFRGDQASLISRLFPDRVFHLFDTFEGFARQDLDIEKTAGFSAAAVGDFANTSIPLVLGKLENPDRVIIHQGFFPETTQGVEDTFAFVSLDVDLHDPTLAGLRWFYDRLNAGGVIFVHDYNNCRYNGVRNAVETFVSETGAPTLPLPDFSGSIAILKPALPA